MNRKEAEKEFWSLYTEKYGSKQNAIKQEGATTIRCAWVDFCDYLVKDHRANEKRVFNWGQVI